MSLVAVSYIVGVIVGCLVTLFIFASKYVGSLQIYYIDPDEDPCMFLALKKNAGEIASKKQILLSVKNFSNMEPHE